MRGDIDTKKRRFRPLKSFRKLLGSAPKRGAVENLQTDETVPTECHVPRSPGGYNNDVVVRQHESEEKQLCTITSPDTGGIASTTGESVDMPVDIVETHEEPLANNSDSPPKVDSGKGIFENDSNEPFECPHEEEKQFQNDKAPITEDQPVSPTSSPIRLIQTMEIITDANDDVEIGIVGETSRIQPEKKSERKVESTLQLATRTVRDRLISPCLGPAPIDPPGRWLDNRDIVLPPAIERAMSAAEEVRLLHQAMVKKDVADPTSRSLIENPNLPSDVVHHEIDVCPSKVPITFCRSMTAPSISVIGSAQKSASFVFHSTEKSWRNEETKVDPSKEPSVIDQPMSEHKEIIHVVLSSDSFTFDDEEACKPSQCHTRFGATAKSHPQVISMGGGLEMETPVVTPPPKEKSTKELSHALRFATSQQQKSVPPPLPLVPRRTVAAVPRTAPLTAANLFTVSKRITEQDDSCNDDDDTTFDLGDEDSCISYLRESESSCNTGDTGSMFGPPSEYSEVSSFLSREVLMDEETSCDGQTDSGVDETTDGEDDDKSAGTMFPRGGELIQMATELQQGGSRKLMEWLDLT